MEEQKFFMWYDSSEKDYPIYGPYYESEIKKNYYHSLDDMLKINFSESLKKKLISAKIGTRIKMHYLHSYGDMMVKRISNEQVESLKKVIELDKEIESLNDNLSIFQSKKKKILHKVYNK